MVDKELTKFVLTHEQDIRAAVAEKKAEAGGHTGGGASTHCYVSDPTATQAIRNVSEVGVISIEYGPRGLYGREKKKIKYPERWLTVINWTKKYYNTMERPEQAHIYAAAFIHKQDRETTCRDMNIRLGKYHAAVNDILAFATGMAVGLGIT